MKKQLLIIILVFSSFSVANSQDYANYYYWYLNFFHHPLFSDENAGTYALPVLVIPSAGKFEAMGTAFTASIADGGVLQSNPAATSWLEKSELAFSYSNWIADSDIQQVYYTNRFDDIGIGARVQIVYANFTRNSDYSEADAYGTIAEGLLSLNFSYNFFSSYLFKGISAGANLKMAFRSIPDQIASDQSAFVIMGDVGFLTSFDFLKLYESREKNFSLGAVFKNLGPPVGLDPLPSEFSLGIAYKPIKPLIVNLDFNLPFNFSPSIPAGKINITLGADLQFAPFLAVQAGLRYDGNNFRISMGATVEVKDITLNINYTHDQSTRNYSDEFADHMSIQLSIDLGDGGRKELQKKADEQFLQGYTAYAEGDFETAINYFEKVLEILPSFDLAERWLITARDAFEAKNRLLDAGQNYFRENDESTDTEISSEEN